MKQFASDEGRFTDDCREHLSGQLKEQRDRRKIDSIRS